LSQADQQAMTPRQALERLRAGNERWTTDHLKARNWKAERASSAAGQRPFAAVIACLDSRASPELVFDQGLGDLFVGRIAGNIVTDELLGSLEFATKLMGSKVVVVLGHDHCGAIVGACDGAELGHLTGLLDQIEPAVAATPGPEPRSGSNPAFVAAVTETNVRLTVERIRRDSSLIRELIEAGELEVVGAIHDIGSGRVRWLE
jgi:carbonic anhydrase